MEVKISNIKELLNDKISVVQRGLVITAILCKDITPKLTLAKFKTFVNLKEHRDDLIWLQDNHVIEWSGYKAALKSRSEDVVNPVIVEIINFMNQLYGTKYSPESKDTVTKVSARLEKFSVEDIKLVIANRWKEWKDDSVMKKYLHPETIFRQSKFEKYIQDARLTHIGESLLEASKIDLKDKQEITLEISLTLVDSENYNVELVNLNQVGEKVRNSQFLAMKGKDIKSSLKTLQNSIEHNGFKEFKYNYIAK
jgi:uncharacterized phage protein (TIGR02220 family)